MKQKGIWNSRTLMMSNWLTCPTDVPFDDFCFLRHPKPFCWPQVSSTWSWTRRISNRSFRTTYDHWRQRWDFIFPLVSNLLFVACLPVVSSLKAFLCHTSSQSYMAFLVWKTSYLRAWAYLRGGELGGAQEIFSNAFREDACTRALGVI